ncbi:MAG TPA: NAD(P)/FAD-dependent oxidoreductase [Verrucomicrobiae bacterium]|nr:NAD(P)/FAD-dependent oxidoreductase [Verrucomicrobiae bacterium]
MPRSSSDRIVVVGGGAAGIFAAISCAELAPHKEIVVLEKGPSLLAKVRISGGGRCNVTNACFDAREFCTRYPRGERELIGPMHRFQAKDTVEWFERRNVKLKSEADGRVFPVTDRSATVIDCLVSAARKAGLKMFTNRGVVAVARIPNGFKIETREGPIECGKLLLATGGTRTPAMGEFARALGHTLEPPVPSLFTFHIEAAWVRELAGVSVPQATVSVAGTNLREQGPVLFTHWGLSGPAILRLSAWGARELHEKDYKFPLRVAWSPDVEIRQSPGLVVNSPLGGLPKRLWAALVKLAGISPTQPWANLNKALQQRLISQLRSTELHVSGKSLNKDEFVTCGGVRLSEVNFKTMESRVCPGLYFAGELLDIDGITGGFNFQAAWTTGWLAGNAMAG